MASALVGIRIHCHQPAPLTLLSHTLSFSQPTRFYRKNVAAPKISIAKIRTLISS